MIRVYIIYEWQGDTHCGSDSTRTSALGFEFEPDTSRNEPNYILQEMTIDGCIIYKHEKKASRARGWDKLSRLLKSTQQARRKINIKIKYVYTKNNYIFKKKKKKNS